jgi:hypothetical protein
MKLNQKVDRYDRIFIISSNGWKYGAFIESASGWYASYSANLFLGTKFF